MTPPASVWNHLDRNLENQKKRKRAAYWWIGLAASLVLTGWFGWNYFQPDNFKNMENRQDHLAINPVWTHPTSKPLVKKSENSGKPIKTVEPQSKPEIVPLTTPDLELRLPTRSKKEKLKSKIQQVASKENITGMNEELVTPVLPKLATAFPVSFHSDSLSISTRALIQAQEEIPQTTPSRKVYGIGFGKYKFKISLASKE